MSAEVAVGDATGGGALAELPGLYGPFSFPEKLLQKIWLRRAFQDRRAVTTNGLPVAIVSQGKWNLLGGPDFKHARLRFGEGPEVVGDVELHLYASDWSAHHHAEDPAYNGVVLHVVLFAPPDLHVTRGAGGQPIPVLVLLPLLHHDLEEYAAEDAVEQLANRPAAQIVELLGALPTESVRELLLKHADARWRQKVRYASLRIQRLGWIEACHQTALDILGYRFNRSPMLRLATAYPFACWRELGLDLNEVFAVAGDWSLQGLRPANHPRLRLQQYSAWVRARPHWMDDAAALAASLPAIPPAAETGECRHEFRYSALRRTWIEAITAGEVSGTRFDNLMCDGMFPLVTARGVCDAQQVWLHWFTGDAPLLWRHALRQLEVFSGRARPSSHGINQGLLGWLIDREQSTSVAAGRRA